MKPFATYKQKKKRELVAYEMGRISQTWSQTIHGRGENEACAHPPAGAGHLVDFLLIKGGASAHHNVAFITLFLG